MQHAVRGDPANQVSYGEMSCWDVSFINDMSHLFFSTSGKFSYFNETTGCWDVSKVTDMSYGLTSSTRQSVSKVTTMGGMFHSVAKFNQDLCAWYKYIKSYYLRGFYVSK